jgi:CDP-diacylglycerol--serine O-phosphatidyltransferase
VEAIKKQIPNFITLGNAACGFVAVLFAIRLEFNYALWFILFGALLDFFDGFAARLLNVKSEMGAQLDSMSDMVTFGVAPGVCLALMTEFVFQSQNVGADFGLNTHSIVTVFVGVSPVLAGAYRLARFNAYPSKSIDFEGLAIPSAGIFLASLPLATRWYYMGNLDPIIGLDKLPYVFLLISLAIAFLMVSKFNLFSLKLNSLSFEKYPFQILFLAISLVMAIIFLLINKLLLSVPLIVLLYLILSLIRNLTKKNEIQSTH